MSRSTRWTDEKVKALKLAAGKAAQRVLVEPGLYLYVRQRSDYVAKQWQYRVQVDGVRKWLSLGVYPAIGLARARAEMLTQHVLKNPAVVVVSRLFRCVEPGDDRNHPPLKAK